MEEVKPGRWSKCGSAVFVCVCVCVCMCVCVSAGTPSLAEPRVVETIVATIRDNLEMTSGTEVTLEANPTSAQTEKLRW